MRQNNKKTLTILNSRLNTSWQYQEKLSLQRFNDKIYDRTPVLPVLAYKTVHSSTHGKDLTVLSGKVKGHPFSFYSTYRNTDNLHCVTMKLKNVVLLTFSLTHS